MGYHHTKILGFLRLFCMASGPGMPRKKKVYWGDDFLAKYRDKEIVRLLTNELAVSWDKTEVVWLAKKQ